MPFCSRIILLQPLPRQYQEEGGGAVVAKKDDIKQSVGVFQRMLIKPMVLLHANSVQNVIFLKFHLSNVSDPDRWAQDVGLS